MLSIFNSPPLIFQDVHEDAEQHVDDVINGFQRGNGRAARGTGPHLTRDLFEAESAALEHDQGLDFRVFEGEASTEHLKGAAIDADEAGSGIVHGLAEDGAQDQAEEANPQVAEEAGFSAAGFHKTRPNDHLATGGAEGFKEARDVARIVLAITIETDDVLEPKFVSQFVPGLDAAA